MGEMRVIPPHSFKKNSFLLGATEALLHIWGYTRRNHYWGGDYKR